MFSFLFELALMHVVKVKQLNMKKAALKPSIRRLLDSSTPEKRRHDGVIKQKGNGGH